MKHFKYQLTTLLSDISAFSVSSAIIHHTIYFRLALISICFIITATVFSQSAGDFPSVATFTNRNVNENWQIWNGSSCVAKVSLAASSARVNIQQVDHITVAIPTVYNAPFASFIPGDQAGNKNNNLVINYLQNLNFPLEYRISIEKLNFLRSHKMMINSKERKITFIPLNYNKNVLTRFYIN